MELELRGRRVMVTGASKGIGLAIAEAFAAEGASLVLLARSGDALERAAAQIRARHQVGIETHATDLSVGANREAAMTRLGIPDILVNNAGAIPGGSLLELTMERWEEAWALKVMGYVHMTKLALKGMAERRSGTIINIVGMAGPQPRWDYICGSAGNAALNAFTKALGGKSHEYGVRIFGINPAATRTDRIFALARTRARTQFGDESRWEETLGKLPFGRLKEPAEVAALAVMLASPKVTYLSGTMIDMDGGGQYRS